MDTLCAPVHKTWSEMTNREQEAFYKSLGIDDEGDFSSPFYLNTQGNHPMPVGNEARFELMSDGVTVSPTVYYGVTESGRTEGYFYEVEKTLSNFDSLMGLMLAMADGDLPRAEQCAQSAASIPFIYPVISSRPDPLTEVIRDVEYSMIKAGMIGPQTVLVDPDMGTVVRASKNNLVDVAFSDPNVKADEYVATFGNVSPRIKRCAHISAFLGDSIRNFYCARNTLRVDYPAKAFALEINPYARYSMCHLIDGVERTLCGERTIGYRLNMRKKGKAFVQHYRFCPQNYRYGWDVLVPKLAPCGLRLDHPAAGCVNVVSNSELVLSDTEPAVYAPPLSDCWSISSMPPYRSVPYYKSLISYDDNYVYDILRGDTFSSRIAETRHLAHRMGREYAPWNFGLVPGFTVVGLPYLSRVMTLPCAKEGEVYDVYRFIRIDKGRGFQRNGISLPLPAIYFSRYTTCLEVFVKSPSDISGSAVAQVRATECPAFAALRLPFPTCGKSMLFMSSVVGDAMASFSLLELVSSHSGTDITDYTWSYMPDKLTEIDYDDDEVDLVSEAKVDLDLS